MALLTAGLKSEFAFLCFLLLIDRRKSRFPAARDWEDGTLAASISWEKREQNTMSILGLAFINHSVQLLWLWLSACLCSIYAWPGVLGSWSKGNMDIDSKAHPSIHPNIYCVSTMCLVQCKVTGIAQWTRHSYGRTGDSSRLSDYIHCTCAWPSFDSHILPF